MTKTPTEEAMTVPRTGPGPLETICDNEWQALLDKDDRTSPAERPDMVLITRAELGGAMCEAYILAKDQAASELSRLQAERDRAVEIIDWAREELHQRRVADWFPEGAHNAAEQMSEDMRLIGNYKQYTMPRLTRD